MKTIIDKKIKESKLALKNGADLETVKVELAKYLAKVSEPLELTEKEIESYTNKIKNIGKSNNILYANKYAIGATALAGTVLIGVAVATSSPKQTKSTPTTNEPAIENQIDDEKEETLVEEVEYVLPDHLAFKADDMEVAKTNISDFINDALTKGLGTIKEDGKLVSSFQDKTLSNKSEAYLNWYLTANINQIDYKVLAELNQQGNLTADMLYQDFIDVTSEIKEDTYSSKETILLEKIFADKNDVEYINKLTDLINRINSSDSKSKDEFIKEAKEIKKDMLVNFAKQGIEVNAAAADYALTQLEVADALLNGKVITKDEDESQLYNSIFKECFDKETKEKMGVEKVDGLVASEVSLKSVFRNKYRMQLVDKFEMSLSYDYEKDVTTSYNYVVKNIQDLIDITNFKANEYTASDWLWLMTSNMSLEEQKEVTSGKTTVTKTPAKDNVKPSEVPKEERVEDEVVVTEESSGAKTTETYIKAKKDAVENASRDVADEYMRLGTSLTIEFKTVPKKPKKSSENYDEVYSYWYAVEFNATLKDFQKQEKEALEANQNSYNEENNNSIIDDSNKTASKIEELKALKVSLQAMVNNELETLETSYVKTLS